MVAGMTSDATDGPQDVGAPATPDRNPGPDRDPGPAAPPPAPAPLTRASAAWVATALGLVLLILVIVFILQNQADVELTVVGLDVNLPLGVAMLVAAVVGGTVVALTGGARVVQLRRQARKARRELLKG